MMTTSERFEDRLLRELRQVVAERPAPSTGSPRRTRRTRLALGGVGVAAVTVAIAVIATGSDVTPNAYAVESHANGAVTVSISALRDATGLQSSLRAAGVPAVVDYSATGPVTCAAPPPESGGVQGTGTGPALVQGGAGVSGTAPTTQAAPADAVTGTASVVTGSAVAVAKPVAVDANGAATLTIAPGQVKPGEHVYITSAGASVGSVAVAITAAAPGAVCVTGAATVSAGSGPDTAPAPTATTGQ